jgi:acid phosphatase (class A)
MNKIAIAAVCLVWGHISVAYARDPSFVAAEETRALSILHAPASADSAKTKAELEELHAIEAHRTAAEIARAVADDKEESIFIFADVIGHGFNAQNLPATQAFSVRVKNDEGINTAPAKMGFQRVRPYNLDKTLHPVCATKTKDDAYPSGHATTGYLMALTLIDMVPEKRDLLLARADEYALNRLVCGVHYRSDIEASKLLAYSIHALMHNKPQYQQELNVARMEVQRFLTTLPR